MPLIYTVEDDENIRELVLCTLRSIEFGAMGFENSGDFWQEMEQTLPDLVLLDIMLPQESGMDILAKLKSGEKTKDIPVIMLTAKGMEYDKVKALDAGADDYIVKPFGVLELLSRIKAVLRRVAGESTAGRLTCDSISLDHVAHTVTAEGEQVFLTYKEFELLQYLLLNKHIVLTRDKIMENVWGFDYEGESRTVDMHIKTLRQKLGNSGGLIKTVRGVGYKLGD